jgi:hypothetical protein
MPRALAQKLVRLHPFIIRIGVHATAWANLYLVGRPRKLAPSTYRNLHQVLKFLKPPVSPQVETMQDIARAEGFEQPWAAESFGRRLV